MSNSVSEDVPVNDLVSCIMVTKGIEAHLEVAVRCYMNQTYRPRELVVVHQGLSDRAERMVTEAGALLVPVPDAEVPLGMLRNMGVEAAHGHYVAQWDDDDWHHPERLNRQIEVLQASGYQGCLLTRWYIHDKTAGRMYESFKRNEGWEGSLVAERLAVARVRYAPMSKGEDTQMQSRFSKMFKTAYLNEPRLCVYTYHGQNTFDARHFRFLIAGSHQLSSEETMEVLRRMTL